MPDDKTKLVERVSRPGVITLDADFVTAFRDNAATLGLTGNKPISSTIKDVFEALRLRLLTEAGNRFTRKQLDDNAQELLGTLGSGVLKEDQRVDFRLKVQAAWNETIKNRNIKEEIPSAFAGIEPAARLQLSQPDALNMRIWGIINGKPGRERIQGQAGDPCFMAKDRQPMPPKKHRWALLHLRGTKVELEAFIERWNETFAPHNPRTNSFNDQYREKNSVNESDPTMVINYIPSRHSDTAELFIDVTVDLIHKAQIATRDLLFNAPRTGR